MLPQIKNRYSPTSFLDKDIEKEKLEELIRAARLAPSSFNNQPWNYVFVSKKDKTRKELEKSLAIPNYWAKKAPYLIVVFAREKDDKPYHGVKYHLYDTGLSVMSLVIEAENQGLKAHQMAGFNPQKVKKALKIPDEYDIVVLIALGYEKKEKNILSKFSEKVRERIIKPRKRKPINENFFFEEYKKI